MLNVIMLSVVMLDVIRLNVVMLNVVRLSVVAPCLDPKDFFVGYSTGATTSKLLQV